jgi:WD40 repeat protein
MSSCTAQAWLSQGPFAGISGLCLLLKELAREFEGLLDSVTTCAKDFDSIVSLADDHVAVSQHSQVFIVDPQSGRTVAQVHANACAMALVGDRLVTGSFDCKLWTWDLVTATGTATCTSVKTIKAGQFAHGSGPFSIRPLPNQQVALYIGSELQVWDLSTGVFLYDLEALHKQRIRCLVGLPDGKLVFALDRVLQVYEDGQFLYKRRVPTKKHVTHLAASERWLASIGYDKVIHMWDTDKVTLLFVISTCPVPYLGRNQVAFLPDGKLACMSLADPRCINIFDLNHQGALWKTCQRPSLVRALTALPHGKLLSCHGNGDFCTWV